MVSFRAKGDRGKMLSYGAAYRKRCKKRPDTHDFNSFHIYISKSLPRDRYTITENRSKSKSYFLQEQEQSSTAQTPESQQPASQSLPSHPTSLPPSQTPRTIHAPSKTAQAHSGINLRLFIYLSILVNI